MWLLTFEVLYYPRTIPGVSAVWWVQTKVLEPADPYLPINHTVGPDTPELHCPENFMHFKTNTTWTVVCHFDNRSGWIPSRVRTWLWRRYSPQLLSQKLASDSTSFHLRRAPSWETPCSALWGLSCSRSSLLGVCCPGSGRIRNTGTEPRRRWKESGPPLLQAWKGRRGLSEQLIQRYVSSNKITLDYCIMISSFSLPIN